jgi:hypothetical protein
MWTYAAVIAQSNGRLHVDEAGSASPDCNRRGVEGSIDAIKTWLVCN